MPSHKTEMNDSIALSVISEGTLAICLTHANRSSKRRYFAVTEERVQGYFILLVPILVISPRKNNMSLVPRPTLPLFLERSRSLYLQMRILFYN